MKRLTFFLCLATFTAVVSGRAQSEGRVSGSSDLKPPTPSGQTAAPAKTAAVSKPLEATLAKDDKGKNPATSFSTSTPTVYLQWKYDGAAKGEKLRAVWVAVDTAGALPKNKKLTDTAQTLPGPGSFGAFFQPAPLSGSFPPGKYRVQLFDNDKLARNLEFTVKK